MEYKNRNIKYKSNIANRKTDGCLNRSQNIQNMKNKL